MIFLHPQFLTPRMGSRYFTCSFWERENPRPASSSSGGGVDKSLGLFSPSVGFPLPASEWESVQVKWRCLEWPHLLGWLILQHLQKSETRDPSCPRQTEHIIHLRVLKTAPGTRTRCEGRSCSLSSPPSSPGQAQANPADTH